MNLFYDSSVLASSWVHQLKLTSVTPFSKSQNTSTGFPDPSGSIVYTPVSLYGLFFRSSQVFIEFVLDRVSQLSRKHNIKPNLRYLFSSSSPNIFFSSIASLSAMAWLQFGVSSMMDCHDAMQRPNLAKSKQAKCMVACETCSQSVKWLCVKYSTCGWLLIVK